MKTLLITLALLSSVCAFSQTFNVYLDNDEEEVTYTIGTITIKGKKATLSDWGEKKLTIRNLKTKRSGPDYRITLNNVDIILTLQEDGRYKYDFGLVRSDRKEYAIQEAE